MVFEYMWGCIYDNIIRKEDYAGILTLTLSLINWDLLKLLKAEFNCLPNPAKTILLFYAIFIYIWNIKLQVNLITPQEKKNKIMFMNTVTHRLASVKAIDTCINFI